MFKSLTKRVLRGLNAEVLRFYPEEQQLLDRHADMSLRDALRLQALEPGGQISIVEAQLLGELVRNSDPRRPIIEIGTLFGFSTRIIAANKPPEQPLITVDNYSWNPLGLSQNAHQLATRAVLDEAIAHHNTRIVVAGAAEFYRDYDGPPPALFFCDADHRYEAVLADLLWARRVGASIICGDDYEPRHTGVTRAVDELGGPIRLAGGLFVLQAQTELPHADAGVAASYDSAARNPRVGP